MGAVLASASMPLPLRAGEGLPWVRGSIVPPAAENGHLHAPADTASALRTIDLAQARALFDGGRALFIDAREDYAFSDGCIPGRAERSLEGFEFFRDALDAVPRDTLIVAYCDGQGCELSVHLGEELLQMGYRRVLVFYGGWVEWVDAGYPVQHPEAEAR